MPSSNVSWGIEVGAGAIKALRLERDGEQIRVADFAILPHKKVLSTPDLNRDDAIAVALGAFMSQYRDALKGTSVAVSLPGHSAFARFAKLPPVEKKGIPNLVRFEAVQQIPFPIEEVEWDYQTFQDDESPDVEVGIFAATKAKITEVLAQYGEQGFVPDIITLSPVAVYNAIAYDLSFTNKTPGTVIVDIGTTATDLIIAEAGKVWIRTFPLGGHNFTEALATTFKLTYGKAEKLKREAETSKYKRHIFQAMKPVLGELVQDVQRSIAYYRDTHPDAEITRLVGLGSTFKLIGLRKLLSQQLKLEVYRFERAKRLQIEGAAAADFEAATPNIITAYGLALQGLGLQTINANLMPVDVIRTAVWKRKTPWFIAAAAIGLAAGGISFLRPMFDSIAVNSAKADNSIMGPIRQTVSVGQQLKSQWTEAGAAQQPGFVAENMRRLREGRELYDHFLRDLGGLFAAATDFASRDLASSGTPTPELAAELRSFESQYFPPNASLGLTSSPASSGRDAAPAQSGGAEGSTTATTAGPAGAFRFTLVFDTPRESRAFVNDSILDWLRANAQRPGVPYTLMGIPTASDIAVTTIRPDAKPGSPAPSTPSRGPVPPPQPQSPPPDERDPFGGGDLGGRPPQPQAPNPFGGPRPGGPPKPASGPATDAELEKLAPLPESLKPAPRSSTVYRYSITWYAQMREFSDLNLEQNPVVSDQTGEEAQQ